MNDALFFSRITFSFFEATAVHCASDAVTMVAYVGYCVGSGTGGRGRGHDTVDPRTTCPANSVLSLAVSPINLKICFKNHDH